MPIFAKRMLTGSLLYFAGLISAPTQTGLPSAALQEPRIPRQPEIVLHPDDKQIFL